MKKNIKNIKVLSFSLVLVMCMSMLSACSLFEPKNAGELLTKSKEVMSKIGNNYHMDISVRFGVNLNTTLLGIETKWDVPIQLQINTDVVDGYMHGGVNVAANVKSTTEYDQESKVESVSINESVEYYLVLDESNKAVVYSDYDEKWQYREITVVNTIAGIQSLFDANLFDDAEMVKENENYIITMPLAELLKHKAISDMIAESLGNIETEDADLNAEAIIKMFGDTIVTYKFDKQYRLVGVYTDKIELNATTLLGDINFGGIDLEELDPNTISANMELTIELSEFGTIKTEDVKVPSQIVDVAVSVDKKPELDADGDINADGEDDNHQEGDAGADSESQEDELRFDPADISDDWRDLDIAIDGVVYTFPYDYDQLMSNGWTADSAAHNYEEGYVMNPGERAYSTVQLTNEKYNDGWKSFAVWCGFKNYSESSADVLECDLWSIELDIMSGWEPKTKYPDVQIAKSIRFGSTKADVVAAFGACESVWEDTEHGYAIYEYSYDYDKYLSLTISDKYGVTGIALKGYS